MKKARLFLLLLVLCFVAVYLLFYSPKPFSFAVYSKPGPDQSQTGEETGPEESEPVNPEFLEQPPVEQVREPGTAEDEKKPPQASEPVDGGENEIRHQSLIDELSFLQSPLPGARITTRDSQLPGAPRPYRNGTHEGLDYYNGYCEIPINYGDPVFAAGPGIIIRIDQDYKEPETAQREEMLEISAAEGDTPEDILDILRGRQIWILHPNGTVTRYAHLSRVAGDLELGDLVEPGAFIGSIGNSGTSDGAEGSTAGAHLHFEIWPTDNAYLGKGLTPSEVRNILNNILK